MTHVHKLLCSVGTCCPIELSPPRVVVRYGDPVSANCNTTESEHGGMGWEASQGGIRTEKDRHLRWSLENLTEWSMSPICFINPHEEFSKWEQCSMKLEVVLYRFPESIRIESSGSMRDGREYTLTCDVGSVAPVKYLTVRWYKGDTIINTTTFDNPSKEPVEQRSVFSLIPTRQDKGVKFRCEAHLDLGPEGPQLSVFSNEITDDFLFGPDIQCSLPELFEGDILDTLCSVTGNPPPIVYWLKNGEPLEPNYTMSREKAGLYTIKAEGYVEGTRDIEVFVIYGPELTCPSNYTAQEYAPYNLTCTVKGYPEPQMIWYKDGDEVKLPDYFRRNDAGQYLINASNIHSSDTQTVELVIKYPPSQILELEDSEVEVGSDVWLKCSSMGNPRPTYSWSYYQTDNVKDLNDDGVSRLEIQSATAYNIGSYTCQASNEIGNVSKTVRITVKGAEQVCPIEITPKRLLIPYSSNTKNVTCTPASANKNFKALYWHGVNTTGATWQVDTHKDWDLIPVCNATFDGIGTCSKRFDFILYKTPDSVSIHRVDNSSSKEDEILQLRCDISNVAPYQNLIVRWYHGNKTINSSSNGSKEVSGCPPENSTNCDIRTPVNVSYTINITMKRKLNEAEFKCQAQLNLGPEGPQHPYKESSPLNITVYSKPVINDTKLENKIPLFSGYPGELVCEADGHPTPKIQWHYNDKYFQFGGKINVTEQGTYICNATNSVGSATHEVKVILKEDYLPLIAGFVAVTVVIISVIFLFIYSIYYKNTKMRRYSLKNPRLSTHNGNVAHNGWDMQFPMTKLS
ncbi:uncharacterized protein LOC128379280 [Scomber scombrus]|uniref:Uncharacterized protein LOC128379280 n=1 Tax=Scomber scombrus TaxID=13677 RepID=A0AAV1PIT0_SCOSC